MVHIGINSAREGEVLLSSFYFNGHNLELHPQTQTLDPYDWRRTVFSVLDYRQRQNNRNFYTPYKCSNGLACLLPSLQLSKLSFNTKRNFQPMDSNYYSSGAQYAISLKPTHYKLLLKILWNDLYQLCAALFIMLHKVA